jgi:predicted nucleic acid-binding protein
VVSDIPEGAVCYLDATIFYYHLVGVPTLSDECSDLVKRIELGRVQGVTSSMALAEATHIVMLAEVVHRHGVAHQGLHASNAILNCSTA